VAPVLLATFGPIPLASVPANLLAVPVAGAVMVWGLTAGLAGGALGEPVAAVLHGPTRLGSSWLELVATRAAAAPLGELGAVQVTVLAGALALRVASRGRPAARVRPLAGALALVVVSVAVVAAHAPVPLRSAPTTGLVRWHAEGTDVVVLGEGGAHRALGTGAALTALRRSGVGGIDLLVVADASVPDAVVDAVLRVHPAGAVLVHRTARAITARPSVHTAPNGSSALDVGRLTVRVVDAGERLVVEAVPRRR
jgi:competence protein ComEC